MSDFAQRIAGFSQRRLALLAAQQNERLEALEQARHEPIAIVGMGCRFPGGADDPASYWRLLEEGVDTIREIPADRWDVEGYYDPDPEAPGKMYCRHGGFLDQVDRFDPQFFNISPREAEVLDPQHRLLLEVTWEALENAGQDPSALRNSRTGVFVGFGADDYAKLQLRHGSPEMVSAYTGTGNAYCYGAGRLSFYFGLQGPCFPVDTACSSSLVALHVACQSLRLGEIDAAITGGVHLMLSPVGSLFLSKARALAPDGRCKTFDASADGYSRGEGCGVVVLKRLSDALASADPIHAVIRGSAINHDGPSSGFTVPNGPAQQAVLRAALDNARVDPTEVDYVEVHGTGTSLGDPIEVRSLAATLGRKAGRSDDRPLVLGSVKTNIGHLEPAAGVAGLMKVVLSLTHETVPAHLHFKEVNPHIELDEGPFVIPTESRPWHRGEHPRRGGVSSFGLSGTNAHVVLEEAPQRQRGGASEERPIHVLTLSARSETALEHLAGRYHEALAECSEETLGDVCFTANAGRARFAHRAAIVAEDRDRILAGLEALREGRDDAHLRGRVRGRVRPKVAFLFTGQGSQQPGMGRELDQTQPTYRRALDRCEEILEPHLGRPLRSLLYPSDGDEGLIDQTRYTQPALFALEYALAETYRSWGLEPDAVLGHSLGEYVAACVAGVLTLEDALEVVARRAAWMQEQPSDGVMAAVFAAETRVREILGERDGAGIAAVNGPREVVLSGQQEAMEEVLRDLSAEGVRARRLTVSHAFHSPAMAPVRSELEGLLASKELAEPKVRLISNLTGEVAGEEVATPEYWGRHLLEPVRFADGIRATHELGCRAFVELGPRPSLLALARRCLGEDAGEVVWAPSLRPDREWEEVATGLATLHTAGVHVDWAGFERDYGRLRVPLPTYPFERRRCWVDVDEEVPEPLIVSEVEALDDSQLARCLEELRAVSREDGALAVNRRATAPLLFFTRSRGAAFHLNRRGDALVVSVYLGPEESYAGAVEELLAHAERHGLTVTLFALEERAEVLRQLGFSTTRMGVWQSIPQLDEFTLAGGAMKRLRSKVNSYTNKGEVAVEEHTVGSDPALDDEITTMIDEWVTRKGRRAPFVALLKEEIVSGRLDEGYRLFLTHLEGRLESVILLTPIPGKGGYLMDLEFYREDMASGCLEYGITTIMERLAAEGCTYFSLGSTFGTQLGAAPGDDDQVRELLESFHDQGILNEDGNFHFKKKFQPETTTFYLCRPRDTDIADLPEILSMLAEPSVTADGRPVAAAAPEETRRSEALAPAVEHREAVEAGRRHPLIGRCLPLALDQTVFESWLDLDLEPLSFLADHRIFGAPVLPATAYLEAALAALAASDRPSAELTEVRFEQALGLPEGAARRFQVVLSPEDGGVSLTMASSDGAGEGDWSVHARSRASGDGSPPAETEESLEEIRARLPEAVPPEEHYETLATYGIDYGPAFRGLAEVRAVPGEALARVVAPEELDRDGPFRLHPALLDACLQAHGVALLASQPEDGTGATYLPVAIERLRVAATRGEELWSHVRVHPTEEQAPQTLSADLRVFDAAGRVVVSMEGFVVRRTSGEALRAFMGEGRDDVFYALEWRQAELDGEAEEELAGTWLVLSDRAGTGKALAEEINRRGGRAVEVHAGESWATDGDGPFQAVAGDADGWAELLARAVEVGGGPLHGAVHLWSLDEEEPDDLDQLAASQRRGCGAVLHLLQALATAEVDGAPRLWLVSRAGAAVRPEEPVATVAGPLWGLGRSIAQEHPEAWGGLVDLAPESVEDEPERLVRELTRPDGEDHVALRPGGRCVARLVPGQVPEGGEPPISAEGSHLVTGGLGGLGLAVARRLVERGARHLVLVSRREEPGEEAAGAVRALEEQGATVRVISADVSRPGDVDALLAAIDEEGPPLAGVVHAAGVLADGALVQQSWDRFEEVMAPKVDGAWLLDRKTAERSLDYFVLFSSTASLFGAAGQGNYAAANAFLDALAHARRRAGRPALAIDWGPWGEVGMAAAVGERAAEQRAAHGVGTLSTERGLDVLEQLLAAGDVTRMGVIVVDWERLLSSAATALRGSSLFKELAAVTGAGSGTSKLVESLLEAPPESHQERLEGYLAETAAGVLRLSPDQVDRETSLTLMGFDSLMALELRETVEAEVGVGIPVLHLIRGDNIREIASHLLDGLREQHPELAAEAEREVDPAELLDQLDELSDEEVSALLEDMVPQNT